MVVVVVVVVMKTEIQDFQEQGGLRRHKIYTKNNRKRFVICTLLGNYIRKSKK
jgi:hypothetical protein